MKDKKYTVVDLFCGCGGISRGFQRTGRFSIELGVELEPHPIQAFAANLTNHALKPPVAYQGDIRQLVGPEAVDNFWEWMRPTGVNAPGELDVLVGGPPCQGFSRNGVRQYLANGAMRFYDDPRNHLYRAFLSAIGELQPKLVLIENVREFLNFGGGKFSEDLLAKLDELGYVADYRKVCAADFGVPQMRHRVLFVAVRRDFANVSLQQLPFAKPTHAKGSSQMDLIGDVTYRTVRDAIADLPEPVYKHGVGIKYPKARRQISAFAEAMRSPTGEVSNHVARKLSALSLARINAVGTGRMKHAPENLQTKSFYGSAYRRLAWDEPSLTITTWVYHVGSGRFAHPEADRCVTMREAARLQSFDDDFIFPNLINPVSQMIGNAVPPLLAQAFAATFAKFLDKHSAQAERLTHSRKNSIIAD
ncbi:DNA cytosine methyltransferase [Massilia arenosa]|uniref:Cytosine-specific methyltransferase n=1 Tax=Zemynaea arenosa TaxID=2561931 RepID=A0A4Y9S015_9BURK|nr:DNA cytosine methyltransferase [Massilia arenosa]TFW13335.1 DNA cytosine methyltransferase [Massilia arenosa]